MGRHRNGDEGSTLPHQGGVLGSAVLHQGGIPGSAVLHRDRRQSFLSREWSRASDPPGNRRRRRSPSTLPERIQHRAWGAVPSDEPPSSRLRGDTGTISQNSDEARIPSGSGPRSSGVADGTRTRDILDHNQVLYQLNYSHHRRTAVRFNG